MESPLQPSSPLGDSLFPNINLDEHFMKQSLLFAGALKDLKNLRSQLYSAADYFESTYTKDPLNAAPLQMVKDYAVGALVNTVDHLGFVSSKVSELVDKEVDIVSATELRVSCIDQRVRTCRAVLDLQEFHFPISTKRHHKHYLLPDGDRESSAGQAVPCRVETMPRVLQPLTESGYLSLSLSLSLLILSLLNGQTVRQGAALSSSTRSRTSSFRNIFSSSSFRWGRSSSSLSARLPSSSFPPGSTPLPESPASSAAPSPTPDLSLRSISFASRRALLSSSTSWLRRHGGARKAAGQSFRGGDGEWDVVEQSPSRSQRMLENFMGRAGRRIRVKSDAFP